MVNTAVTLCGLPLENPVIPASGTFGYGYEFAQIYDINCLGTFSFKGTTLTPRYGNPTPRIAEYAGGLLNSVGLQNPGVEAVIREELPRLREVFHKPVMANVSGFNPSVTGVTGMETADLIQKVVSMVKPDVTVVIDSLAARNMERMSTTIQVCDTGIEPGAGMGNRRKAISEETLGCKVISIGVPTVIDSRTLIMEAAENISSWQDEATEKYLSGRDFEMIVTSTDIDEIIKDFSEIIANAINITLHPGIYS